MLCTDTARRKSTTSDEEVAKRFDMISVYYCSACASAHKLPIYSRLIVRDTSALCDICGEEKKLTGSVMKDSQLLNNVHFAKREE
jgi:hypothetical protein